MWFVSLFHFEWSKICSEDWNIYSMQISLKRQTVLHQNGLELENEDARSGFLFKQLVKAIGFNKLQKTPFSCHIPAINQGIPLLSLEYAITTWRCYVVCFELTCLPVKGMGENENTCVLLWHFKLAFSSKQNFKAWHMTDHRYRIDRKHILLHRYFTLSWYLYRCKASLIRWPLFSVLLFPIKTSPYIWACTVYVITALQTRRSRVRFPM